MIERSRVDEHSHGSKTYLEIDHLEKLMVEGGYNEEVHQEKYIKMPWLQLGRERHIHMESL